MKKHDTNILTFPTDKLKHQKIPAINDVGIKTNGEIHKLISEEKMFYYERLFENYDADYLQIFVVNLHQSTVAISGRIIDDQEVLDGSGLITVYGPQNKILGYSISIDEFIKLTCLDPNSITDITGYLHTYFQSHNITDFKTKFYSITKNIKTIDETHLRSFHPEKIVIDLKKSFPIVECYFYNQDQFYISIKEQDFNEKTETILLLDMLILGLYNFGSLSDIENIYIQEGFPGTKLSTTIIEKEYISRVIESALKGFSWEYSENYKDIEKAIKHYYKTQLEKKLDIEEEYDDENE